MPELPEVEMARRRLSPALVGRSIEAVRLLDATLYAGTSGELEAAVVRRTVRRVDRRGKVLILALDPPGSLLIRLKMTGQLIVLDPGTVVAAAGHPSPRLPARHAARPQHPRRRHIRPLRIADETLFRARIHPARRAGSLQQAEARRLHAAIRHVLRAAIDAGGTSVAGYVNQPGGVGRFFALAQVFRRAGQPCHRCGSALVRTVIAGRSSVYCPACQPARAPHPV